MNFKIKEFKWIFEEKEIIIKISLLNQLELIRKFLEAKELPITEISYGEIARTKDLQNYDIYLIAKIIKNFCIKNEIKFSFSTPKIVENRDFDRLYDDIKKNFSDIQPNSLIINNINLFNRIINDNFFKNINIECGRYLINNKNFEKIIKNKVYQIDLSKIKNLSELSAIIKSLQIEKSKIKYTTIGNTEIEILDICPLKTNSQEKNGLFCKAPCNTGKTYTLQKERECCPFITDGFCKVHIFENKIKYVPINNLKEININSYIIDVSALDEEISLKILKNSKSE